jgi:hypothetical protein
VADGFLDVLRRAPGAALVCLGLAAATEAASRRAPAQSSTHPADLVSAPVPPTPPDTAPASGHAGPAFDLAQYRDKNRLLLLFAPSAADPSYADEIRAFRSRGAEVRDRELVAISVLEAGTSTAGDRPLSAADAAALRRRYRAPAGRFTAVLVGKDGHAALRSGTPIVADRLFPTIDAMPMRRAEMRRRGEG